MEPEQGDDLPTSRWSRKSRCVWPLVRAALMVLQMGAEARHHECLAFAAQALVVLVGAAAETRAGKGR